MNVCYEMRHLVVRDVESVELALQVSVQPSELLLVRHGHTPRQTERVLDLFEFKHEGEYFSIACHDFFCEYGGQR